MTTTRLFALAAVASLGCGESVDGSSGTLGTGAAASTTTTTTTGGAGGAGADGGAASSGGGTASTCDDLGFCGQPMDPGCVACAMSEGSCQEEADACQAAADNACLDLLDCYRDCEDGDTMCFDACDAKFPTGVLPLSLLLDCVFCDECPVSCHIDTSSCS